MIAQLRALATHCERPRARRFCTAAFIVVAGFLTFFPLVRYVRTGTQFDYHTWYDAGQTILQHKNIYPESGVFPFMYPPACALFLAVPAFFGKPALILILDSLNTLAWVLSLKFSLFLAGARQFPVSTALLCNLPVFVFVWSSYHLGQPSIILFSLMLGAFLSLTRRHEFLAGALIAVAAAIKAFPVLAIIYLVYRGYWKAALSLLVSLLFLLCILPMPVRGATRVLADLRAWQRGMLHYEEGGIAQRAERGYSWKNQSAFGLANRLLRHVSANTEGQPPIYANFTDLDFPTVNHIVLAAALILGLSYVAVMPWRSKPIADPLEWAALLTLILIFTPLAFGYLFLWLMLPLAVLAQRMLTDNSIIALNGIAAAITLLLLTALTPRYAQIYGSLFFAALALYLALALELFRVKRTVAR